MRVGVFHPGSQNAWQRAYAFQEADALGWYATSAYFQPSSCPVRLASYLPERPRAALERRLLKRWYPPLDQTKIRRMGGIEFGELALRRLGWVRAAHPVNVWGNRRFGDAVIRLIQREPVDTVWGYNSSSLEVFRWAKARGLTCILDQSIGHPAAENEILRAEQAAHPAFFPPGFKGHSEHWIARNDEELTLADKVLVGSQAAADTLTARGHDAAKIVIVPYGADETLFPATPPPREVAHNRPLKLLFVGAIGPRKGAAHLLPALASLPRDIATATLVGRLDMPRATFADYAAHLTHIPQVPRGEVVSAFAEADLFLFPSLFEGGGIVLAEALGSGLPILQGPASGIGATHDVTGHVLPKVSSQTIRDAVCEIAADPERLTRWRENAWDTGRERRWADFRAGLRAAFVT